ncbi:MAG TPA: FapA family protein [Exilispira sp.]|mgnify:FL=1|nr:FapA family protein [Exilispira sp.]
MDKLKNALRNINFGFDSKKIEVEAPTLEKAISEACKRLRATIDEIDYEITQYGSKGFGGIGNKNYKILAYKRPVSEIIETISEEEQTIKEEEEIFATPVDGYFAIIKSRNGVLLKVVPPQKNGKPVKLKDVENALKNKKIEKYNENLVKQEVSKPSGQYMVIGPYEGIEENSATVQINVGINEMTATLTLFPPKPGGFELTPDEILSEIQAQGVSYGILEDVVTRIADEKIEYKEIVIARAKQPVHGKDAEIKMYFDPNAEKTIYKSIAEDKFDFKNIVKNIQNVLKGDLICEKIPATPGEDGYTVTGKLLPARKGVDRQILAGPNTELSPDGKFLRATVDGHVVKKAGKIGVEPVKHINGDVGIKTGNITFVGSVVVHGSVLDGFSVKAKGNIEIRGSVGKCEIISDSDIYIAQGINGHYESIISAEGSVFSKFIENSKVFAGVSVIVDDHIYHSEVNANDAIVCFGHRAQIGGGTIRAANEVNTRNLGTVSYSETIVEVGMPPKLRINLQEYMMQKKKTENAIDDLKRDIATLNSQRKLRKNWSNEKEELLKNKIETLGQQEEILKTILEGIEEIKNKMESINLNPKVAVKNKIYAGVKIYFKYGFDPYEITYEQNSCTLRFVNNEIKAGPYEPPEVDRKLFDKRILSLRNKL